MNTIVVEGIAVRKCEDGRTFKVALVTGSPCIAVSSTGKAYLAIPKAFVPIRDDDAQRAEQLVGTELQGCIRQVKVEPYTFLGRDGKPVTCATRYQYCSE